MAQYFQLWGFVLLRRRIAVAGPCYHLCVSHIVNRRISVELSHTVCFSHPLNWPGVARGFRERTMESYWPSVFGMQVSQITAAIRYVIEIYCVGCMVCFLVFWFCFLDLINKYNTSWSCVAGSYSVFSGDCLLFQ